MNIRTMNPRGFLLAALIAVTSWGWPVAASAEQMHVAFGDIATVESLNFLIALERAKERGVDVKVTFFKSEDIAAQAVVSGEADIGVGTPYALIQKVKAPIRMFYQMSALRFFPIVNTEFYKSWKDLDGQEVAVHARGSGTEAIMKLMAQKNGITYSNISYVPGAEVRAGALLQGNVKASIVDSDQQEDAGAEGARQVRRPADGRRQRHRRGALCQHRVPDRARRPMSRSWSRSC